ncbi:MAG: sulfotransferase family protein [Proteobacteria bacterium]|jgi:hypothetical protein|nr:sulfotransferase family protein [Pseudomonadota bacterium]
MSLRLIGAGVGRTGTLSLRAALETLLGPPCYHMFEVREHPEHIPLWHAAARGEALDWQGLLGGYQAAVDWPASAFWPEISAAFPDAIILLSTRSAESWWKSASETIFPATLSAPDSAWRRMIDAMFANRFTTAIDDKDASIAAFEAHNRKVRELAPPARLVEWQAGDGWAPLCKALGVPIPDLPFPHVNSTEEFREKVLKSSR